MPVAGGHDRRFGAVNRAERGRWHPNSAGCGFSAGSALPVARCDVAMFTGTGLVVIMALQPNVGAAGSVAWSGVNRFKIVESVGPPCGMGARVHGDSTLSMILNGVWGGSGHRPTARGRTPHQPQPLTHHRSPKPGGTGLTGRVDGSTSPAACPHHTDRRPPATGRQVPVPPMESHPTAIMTPLPLRNGRDRRDGAAPVLVWLQAVTGE